jgi:hypothetical protein
MRTSQLKDVSSAPSRRRPLRTLIVTAAIFVGAIVVAVSAAGSTYALWNGAAPIQTATITTGTTGLAVNNTTSYAVPGLNVTQLLPGVSIVSPQPFTVKNTGSTPLSVTVAAPAFTAPAGVLAPNLTISLIQSATCVASIDGTTVGAWTSPLVLAAGQSVPVCLQVGLNANAPASVQGVSASFTIALNGVQVHG